MKKIVLFILISVFSLTFPFGIVFASNEYYNKIYNFSMKLEDGWHLFSDSMLNIIPPEEKTNLVEAFVNKGGDEKGYVSVFKEESELYKKFNEIIDYAKKTPEVERNYERYFSSIESEFGIPIIKFEVDSGDNPAIFFIMKEGHWKEIYVKWIKKENLIFELKLIDDNPNKFFEEKSEFFRAFDYPASTTNNTMGSAENINKKKGNEQVIKESKKKEIDDLFSMMFDKKVMFVMAGIVIIIFLFSPIGLVSIILFLFRQSNVYRRYRNRRKRW